MQSQVLRHLNLEKFRGYLKRKHEGEAGRSDSWDQIAAAQTNIAQAKEANRTIPEGQMAISDADALWSPDIQKVLESNTLFPTNLVESITLEKTNSARSKHLDLKMFIKNQGSPFRGDHP